MKKVLGLDIGSNSIGWSLINTDENSIIDMGVRIFKEGVNKLNQENEKSKNAERSIFKQIRRMNKRKKLRKKVLLSNLVKFNFIEKDRINELKFINPYPLRNKAVTQKIELFELSKIFTHFIARRGYKSNRKDRTSEKDKGAIYDGKKSENKPGINDLKKAINDGGFMTLGQYLNSLNPHEVRIRNRYTERSMYEYEFDAIWDFQKQFYSDIMNDNVKYKIRNKIIFYQRPLKSQKSKIGNCPFEKNKKRSPKSSFLFQEFRMLQQINSLRVTGENRAEEPERSLTNEEREKLINYLKTEPFIKFTKLKKDILKLPKKKKYSFNIENQDKINGLKTFSELFKVFGNDIYTFSKEKLQLMWNTLNFAEDYEWLLNYSMKKFNLSQEQAEKFSKIHLEPDYGNISLKAINKMIPFMRQGKMYHEAAAMAGYNHSLIDEKVMIMNKLPQPPIVPNPIVNIAMHQIKKVVNCIIDHYGKPDTIKVELATELKLPISQRVEILNNNKKREKEANNIRDILKEELNFNNPSRNDIIKYRLWEECGRICPYTGKSIALNQLYSGEFEIEHIIPYSRSLDNSFMNLSLCSKEENAKKNNKTPYEAYSPYPIIYDEIKSRISNFPQKKANRFLVEELELTDFISRKLNDTRYISKLALSYLKHIIDDVQAANGSTTSTLRYLWGLNSILKNDNIEINTNNINDNSNSNEDDINESDSPNNKKKIRIDHRHHAIDALVIALTTRSYLQKLSTLNRLNRNRDKDKNLAELFPIPWDSFYNDTKSCVNRIIISHRVHNKVRGQIHDSTICARINDHFGNQRVNSHKTPLFVVRKKLDSDISANQVLSIVDDNIKKIVLNRISSVGVNVNSSKFKIPKNAFAEPLYIISKDNSKKTPIKSVRIYIPASNMIHIHDYNAWAESGNNHHAILYNNNIGKKPKQEMKVVSLYEAYKRKINGLPIIDKILEPNKVFIMTLCINEMLFIGDLKENFDFTNKHNYSAIFDKIYRVQKMDANCNIVFRKHNTTITDDKVSTGILRKSASSIKGIKIIVDPAGFIELAND